jgi:hypothetical protein
LRHAAPAALTDWLDASSIKSFGAMVLDMYPRVRSTAQTCADGQNPFEIACWFDSGNYMIERNWTYGNLWIQGGPAGAEVLCRHGPNARRR